MCEEWRAHPAECTSLLPNNMLDCLNSLYHIPDVMFCSLRSYLLSISWIVCRELQLFISCLILLHLLLHNDLDRNPLSCPFVHRILPSTVCLRHSCIPIPVWWLCHSCLWFLSHCYSPVCRNSSRVHYLQTHCLTHILLLVLESILFLNSLEVEWGV